MIVGHTATVLELPAFAEHKIIRDFLRAWLTWRGDSMVPHRNQIKLTDISSQLTTTVLLDMRSEREMVFRYAGSRVEELYKLDLLHKNYLDLTDISVRGIRSKRLWHVVTQPAVAVWAATTADDVDCMGASVPLISDTPDVPHMLLQILVPMKDFREMNRPLRSVARRTIGFADKFKFLDIGAGLPDPGFES